jgi:hypothetical protein
MFPTLAILNSPKSGTPDFGVKPGNDGGERINFIRSCSNLHIIGAGGFVDLNTYAGTADQLKAEWAA